MFQDVCPKVEDLCDEDVEQVIYTYPQHYCYALYHLQSMGEL